MSLTESPLPLASELLTLVVAASFLTLYALPTGSDLVVAVAVAVAVAAAAR